MIFQANMDDGECAQRVENTGPHRGEGFQIFCLPSKNNTLFGWYEPKTSICLFPIEARTRTVQPESLYINLCMGKTTTFQAFYQVCGKMTLVASFLQKLITKSYDPISA